MQELKIKLVSSQKIADNTMQYNFKKPKEFNFKAGQFVILDILNPNYTDNRPSFRSLSIASSPHEDVLSFIMRQSDSAFKKNMFELKKDEEVLIKGPLGHMHLPESEAVSLFFLIAGVGVTPAVSMTRFIKHQNLKNPVTLLYANRTVESSACLDELESLDLTNYKFLNILSHENPSESCAHCISGRINKDLISKNLDNLATTQFYIVGTSGFASAMKKYLEDLGAKKDQINIDNFG